VELHGGTLKLDATGQPTRFTIRLPRRASRLGPSGTGVRVI
jgi:signal transduction histidine kinase